MVHKDGIVYIELLLCQILIDFYNYRTTATANKRVKYHLLFQQCLDNDVIETSLFADHVYELTKSCFYRAAGRSY